ncbi:MAG: hypothetical protein P8N52_01580, partial [Crocinitomicaceae bacterium]|nr:hypothetical protein [Crocinitomicaceae bacterium]
MKQFTLLLAILTMFSWQSYSQTSTCDYTFDMTDSFGDGWNGATVDFVQNGLIVASQTLASGSSGTATVALDDNVTTYLIGSSAGSYSGETGFTFNDPSGVAVATLASGVGYVSGDTLATFTTVCPAPPACLDPTALSAANITDVSADLSWTDAAASGSSNVEYGTAGFALGMGTQILGTGNTTESIGSLLPATAYEFYVQSDCGTSQSLWSGPYAFTTNLCGSADQCDYTFEMIDSYGDGWNGASFSFVQGGNVVSTQTLASGTISTAAIALCTDFAAYVIVDAIGSYANEVSFNVIDPFGVNVGSLSTGSLSGSVAGDTLATFTANCTAPLCDAATGLTASNITSSSADVSWDNAGSGSYNLEFQTAGFTQGTGFVVPLTDTTLSIPGLTAATSYDYYIQVNCGSALSTWVGPYTFTTGFNAPAGVVCASGNATFVFSDDLETNTGWTGDIGSSAGQWEFPESFPGGNSTGTGPSGPASGTTFAEYEASGSQDTASMVTPMIDLGTASSEAELSFNMHAYGIEIGTLNVGVGNSPTGPFTNEFSWTGQYQTAATDPWANIGVDLTAYLGQQIYIEFSYAATGPGFYGDLAIDLVQVETCVSCIAPSTLAAANITDVSADVSWVDVAASGSSNVEYGVAGFTLGTGTQILGTANVSESLSGLTAGTTYEVYVQADCGADQSAWVGPVTFTTNVCDAASQCDHTFEMIDSYGDGWNGNSFSFVQGGTTVSTETLATGSTATATVALCDGVTTYVIFANVGSFTGEVSFNVNDAYGLNVAFLAAGALPGAVAGDTIATFTTNCTPPACLDPTALTASNVGVSTADLSWTDVAASGLSNVEYGVAGFTLGTGTVITGTTNTTESISGLMPVTTYEFYVQSDCGTAQSTWVGPFAFTTLLCPATSACDYTFNMVDSYGDGWNGNEISFVQNGVTVSTGTIATGSSNTATIALCDGVATDVVYATVGTYASEMSFDVVDPFGVTVATAVVGSVSGAAGTVLATFTTNCTAPSCADPTALTASNMTDVSADLSWTDAAASGLSNVEYGVAGFTLGTGTAITGTTNTTESISGLSGNTTYEFYVQSDCGGDQSAWVGPIAFTTPCSALALPWSEGMDNAGALPGCWSMAGSENWQFSNTAGFNHIGNNGVITGNTDTDGYFAWVDASGGAVGDSATLTSPMIDISSLTVPQLSFYELSDNEGGANSQLGVEVWNGSTWSSVGTYNTNTAGWEEKIIDLSGIAFTGPAQVRFTFSELTPTDYVDDIAIDDVSFEETPTCLEPISLMASNVTISDADLSWTDAAASGLSNVEYGVAGFTLGTGTAITGTANTTESISGLASGTTYEFYVQSDCGVNQSAWVGPFAFTTDA